jgi:inositol hexakisphosphate/diphosphoinositol-pentakisphosphate kinase
LIAFFSTGFPLHKAIDYVKLRQPVCVNDVAMQYILQDRRCVLKILDACHIPTPRRFMSQREDIPQVDPLVVAQVKERLKVDLGPEAFPLNPVVQVDEETIMLGPEKMKKPFVEKPVSGEDHNINIYFDQASGGGARCLFRKVFPLTSGALT